MTGFMFSLLRNRVYFIKENYRWRHLSCIEKNLSDFFLTFSYIFIKNFRAFNWNEIHVWLCGQCLCKHRLGAARRAIKENSLRRGQTSFVEYLRIFYRVVYDVFQLGFYLLISTYIAKVDFFICFKIFINRLIYWF